MEPTREDQDNTAPSSTLWIYRKYFKLLNFLGIFPITIKFPGPAPMLPTFYAHWTQKTRRPTQFSILNSKRFKLLNMIGTLLTFAPVVMLVANTTHFSVMGAIRKPIFFYGISGYAWVGLLTMAIQLVFILKKDRIRNFMAAWDELEFKIFQCETFSCF